MKEAAYRILAGCSELVVDLQIDEVSALFVQGLHDEHSVEVRIFGIISYYIPDNAAIGSIRCSPRIDRLPEHRWLHRYIFTLFLFDVLNA